MTDHQHDLINAYCAGSITESEFVELEMLLRNDANFRKVFLEYRGLESALRSAYDSGALGFSENTEQKVLNKRTITTLAFIKIAALGLMALGLLYLVTPKSSVMELPKQDLGVAVFMKALDAKFQDINYIEGDTIEPGRLKLLQGHIELEFYSGASVVLEGPAELEIRSRNGGVLHRGKLRANVPEHAHGFTITSEDVQLVDLGTSFGMSVVEGQGTEVQVFDGKVELFSPEAQLKIGEGLELNAGEGRQLGRHEEAETIMVNEDVYLSSDELAARANKKWLSGFAEWEEHIASSFDDKDLVVRYGFTKDLKKRRSLVNYSNKTFKGIDGAIIGAQWSEGRWPKKQALDFKRPGDRVRIHVEGSYKSMTLSTWIRIDGFDNQFNSLMLSDGWEHVGAVHWQILKDGHLELAVQNGKKEVSNNSRVSFEVKPTDFGRWVHIVSVYDGSNSTVTHYRDGRRIGSNKLNLVVPLKIKNAELGNWTTTLLKKDNRIRNFNGRMDDFSIYSRALSSKEVKELFEIGDI